MSFRTDRYEITKERHHYFGSVPAQLVVRRGQSFDIDIDFDRPFDPNDLDIRLIFTVDTANMSGVSCHVITCHVMS